MFSLSLRVFITGLQESGSNIWLLDRLKATAKEQDITSQEEWLHMNCSFSLTALLPVVALDAFSTAGLTAKIQQLWKQRTLNNSPDLQTACLLSQPFLYHSSSLTMSLCLQTPLTDTFWGTCSSMHHWDTNTQCCTAGAEASKGLILLSFSAGFEKGNSSV